MARVELAPGVLEDFERFLAHMERFEVADGPARIARIVQAIDILIVQAIDILSHSPLIGRPVRGGKRELVIGRDEQGYVALYRFVARTDTVFVLAIWSQREAG